MKAKLTDVFVAFDLDGGKRADYAAFLKFLKKRKWKVSATPAFTVSAKFKADISRQRIRTVLQEDFDSASKEVGTGYTATAAVEMSEWTFEYR